MKQYQILNIIGQGYNSTYLEHLETPTSLATSQKTKTT